MADESTKEIAAAESPAKAGSDVVEAMNHLVQGKRHLLVQDIPSAVDSLQAACTILGKEYGETANECGEAYLLYGKALLELSREETGVLALDDGQDEESDDSKDGEESDDEGEDEEEVKSSGGESLGEDEERYKDLPDGNDTETKQKINGEVNNTSSSTTVDKSSKPTATKSASKPVADPASSSNSSAIDKPVSEPSASDMQAVEASGSSALAADDCQPSTSTGNPEGETNSDEVTTLQEAWDMLELAKIIFSRQAPDNKTMKLKLSDVYLSLGEVGMESENYEQSVADLYECLRIRKEILDPDDRQLAETHYQLGLAFSFNYHYPECLKHYTSAAKLIEQRIANLNKQLATEPTVTKVISDGAPQDPVRREIAELNDILPDIKERIKDAQDMMMEADNPEIKNIAASLLGKMEQASSTTQLQPQTVKEARPISSILVKRKRKPEDEQPSSDIKKVKIDSPSSTCAGSGDVSDGVGQSKKINLDASVTSSELPQGCGDPGVQLTAFNVKESEDSRVNSNFTATNGADKSLEGGDIKSTKKVEDQPMDC